MLQTASADSKIAKARGNAKSASGPGALQAPPLHVLGNQAMLRLQRKCDCGGGPDCDCDSKEKKQHKGGLRRAPAGSGTTPQTAPPIVHETLQSPGEMLDRDTRAFFESRFGQDFSGVRIHTDSRAAESARAVNALAYTVGRDIAFAPGRFAPATTEGRRLLAHELTHTVQQRRHSSVGIPTVHAKLSVGDPGDIYEQEADQVASRVIQMPDPGGPALQRQCAEKSELPAMQPTTAVAASGATQPPIVDDIVDSTGQPQTVAIDTPLEPRFAYDLSRASVEVIRPPASTQLVAALSVTGEEVEGNGEDVLTAQADAGVPAPPPGSPAATCNYVVTYKNEHEDHCDGGRCGAKVVFDITGVTATGAACPRTLDGLRVTEVVTNDHGCTPANVQGGAGCPIEEHPPLLPGHGIIQDCTDTYGVCLGATSQARIPPAGCTETVTQQIFVGGVLAETHLIRFPITKSATGCTGTVNRA